MRHQVLGIDHHGREGRGQHQTSQGRDDDRRHQGQEGQGQRQRQDAEDGPQDHPAATDAVSDRAADDGACGDGGEKDEEAKVRLRH